MLDPKAVSLAQGKNLAIVTTIMPNGAPQSLPVWVDADEEHILINTEVHRQRYKNVQANPLVTVTIVEEGNWYSFAEVRGHLDGEVRGPEARDHIDKLAKKYMDVEGYPNPIESERVILKIAPDKQNVG